MTKEELIKKLKRIQKNTDIACAHGDADDALLEFINDKDIAKEYSKIDKWYA